MLVVAAGGAFLPKIPPRAKSDVIVVTCDDDSKLADKYAKQGLTVVTAEFVLRGIFRYDSNPAGYKFESN